MLNKVVASAPGKVILYGEHSVVYGEPAIAIALSKRAYTTVYPLNTSTIEINAVNYGIKAEFPQERKKIDLKRKKLKILQPIWEACLQVLEYTNTKQGLKLRIESEIPRGAGLGSSAAVAVSTIMAVSTLIGAKFPLQIISKLAYEAEKIVHETPSGIDNTIATFGGAVLFQKGNITKINVKENIPLVIGDTGIERVTKQLVLKVKSLKEKYNDIITSVIKSIGLIIPKALKALNEGDLLTLGELMNINQGLLDALGVSTREIAKLIYAARTAGAYGAKLTGAGGGGCIIALTSPEKQKKVAEAIENEGGKPLITKISIKGVKIEEK